MSILIDLLVGSTIGLTLGLLGGGGSILTVPALVYIVGQTPQVAVTASLVIVGANSVLGAFFHRAQGTLNWRVALLFGGVGMIAAYFSAGLSHLLSSILLLVLFALLMLAVGALMIFRKTPSNEEHAAHSWFVIAAAGIAVGVLTGFLGVGGGFLIVPALVMLVGLPMRQAVGTSLVVIAMNSLAGILGHLSQTSLDYTTIGLFVIAGLAGTFVGSQLARRVRAEQLRQMFAAFVIILAIFLLFDNLPKLV
ncbi:MAG: sulfite exporter TauE/SafE family protein [Caldilineaceae bacterium]